MNEYVLFTEASIAPALVITFAVFVCIALLKSPEKCLPIKKIQLSGLIGKRKCPGTWADRFAP